MQTATFTKTITAQFEQVGRRQKLVGQLGEIRDESGLLIHSQLYTTAPEAEQALNALVRELLIDYAERGLVDTLPEPSLVNWNSATAATPSVGQRFTHIAFGTGTVIAITDDEHLNIQVKFDSPSQFGSKFWFDTSEVLCADDNPPADAPGNDCPDHGPSSGDDCPKCAACHTAEYPASAMQPAFCIECVNAMLHGLDNRFAASQFAQTRQSIAIEAKLVTCPYCQGIHHIQACPSIRNAVFAPIWVGADLGRGLCQMRWRDHAGFVALLREASPTRLREYAESYVAFIRDNRPGSSLTAHEVVTAWVRQLCNDRGPAAPALRLAA